MKLSEALTGLVEVLDRVHTSGYDVSGEARFENSFPTIVRCQNGQERYFTRASRPFLHEFALLVYESNEILATRIQLEEFVKLVREVVAELHLAGAFASVATDPRSAIRQVKSQAFQALDSVTSDFVHHFPAWTGALNDYGPVTFGPVTIRSRADWVQSVDFSHERKNEQSRQPYVDQNWKQILLAALGGAEQQEHPLGLAGKLYGPLKDCHSVVSVQVRGAQIGLSRKLAQLVCKCALDCLSLGFGPNDFFFQQALCDERLPPLRTWTISEFDGVLWEPGSSRGARFQTHTSSQIAAALRNMQAELDAYANVLRAHVDPSKHLHPRLANRWSTALEWFAEGLRESNDSLALAKLGICLDVLSGGKQEYGICEMLTHLTGIASDQVVVKGLRPRTLKQLVSDIYCEGRSRIVHGTHYMRLKDYAQERRRATELGRLALMTCVVRLRDYTGGDADEAFMKMPEVKSA